MSDRPPVAEGLAAAERAGEERAVAPGLAAEMQRWCRERGLSQSVLAMRVGASISHINQIMNGRAQPSPRLAQRILRVVGGRSGFDAWRPPP